MVLWNPGLYVSPANTPRHLTNTNISQFGSAMVIGAVSGVVFYKLTNILANLFAGFLHAWLSWLPRPPTRRSRRRQQRHAATTTPKAITTTAQHTDEPRATTKPAKPHRSSNNGTSKQKDRHIDTAIYSSDSDSDSDLPPSRGTREGHTKKKPKLPAATASPKAKVSWRRMPPAGVRVADTIHEESSD